MFGMRFGSDDAALIPINAIQSMQHVQVMRICSPIMRLIFPFLLQRVSLHRIR